VDQTGQSLADYVRTITERDGKWRLRAHCRGASSQVVEMFTCLEDEDFEILGRHVTGFDVQTYLVEAYCHLCEVQWECAREAVVFEEREGGDRSTGAWAMTRRDRRWLAKQPDALGIIDRAKVDGVPVSVAIADIRHNSM
jgi:hypothetical protein